MKTIITDGNVKMNNMENNKKEKLIYQLFIGMVSDLIGVEKTTKLLKEAQETFKDFDNTI